MSKTNKLRHPNAPVRDEEAVTVALQRRSRIRKAERRVDNALKHRDLDALKHLDDEEVGNL